METEPFQGTLALRARNRWLLGLAALPGLLAAVLTGAFFAAGIRSGTVVPALSILSILALTAVLRRNLSSVPVPSQVEVGSDGLRVGTLFVPRSRIKDARIVPRKDGACFVRVSRRGRLPIDLDVRDKGEGRRLLRALGFDAAQTVMRFRGSSQAMASVRARGALLLVLTAAGLVSASGRFPLGTWSIVGGLALVVFPLVLAMLVPTRIDVGADGILLTWFGRKRFIPSPKIASVDRYVDAVGANNKRIGASLTLHGGEVVNIPMGSAQWNEDDASALIERIHEAIDTYKRGTVAASTALLGRRGRSLRDWIEDLRAIGSGANATLRVAPVQPETLWRVIESPSAAVEERAAAAVALASAIDDGGKDAPPDRRGRRRRVAPARRARRGGGGGRGGARGRARPRERGGRASLPGVILPLQVRSDVLERSPRRLQLAPHEEGRLVGEVRRVGS